VPPSSSRRGPLRLLSQPIDLREALALADKHHVKYRRKDDGHYVFYLPDRPVSQAAARGTRQVHCDIARHLNFLERRSQIQEHPTHVFNNPRRNPSLH